MKMINKLLPMEIQKATGKSVSAWTMAKTRGGMTASKNMSFPLKTSRNSSTNSLSFAINFIIAKAVSG